MSGRDRLAFRSNLGFCVPGVLTQLAFPVKTKGPSGVSGRKPSLYILHVFISTSGKREGTWGFGGREDCGFAFPCIGGLFQRGARGHAGGHASWGLHHRPLVLIIPCGFGEPANQRNQVSYVKPRCKAKFKKPTEC